MCLHLDPEKATEVNIPAKQEAVPLVYAHKSTGKAHRIYRRSAYFNSHHIGKSIPYSGRSIDLPSKVAAYHAVYKERLADGANPQSTRPKRAHTRQEEQSTYCDMGRWVKPDVYPLMAAMGFVTTMCVFQLTRNVLGNPDVRISKAHRAMAVLDNEQEGKKYVEHSLRKFLRTRPPEVMPTINRFFSKPQ
ncbi:hypothetical protein SAY86_019899 [Trapa natans]|uniref:Uncharacterized protein n=1 Tax=Trapa natans TaxID=22666 RepID=A0AAN7LMJ5_TRANT|nr:hypothetical protein SAY86_019899 [Trapa natans]